MQALPSTGFIRQAQLLGDPKADPAIPAIIPVGPSTLWRWVAAGTFPKPVKLSPRVTAWHSEDVRVWLDSHRSAA